MNKYRHYRVGLLTGLLSLNILSACVHTRQELGTSETKCFPNCTKKNMYRCYHDNSKKIGCCIAGALCVLPITAAAVYGVISHLANPTDALHTTSGSNATTIRSLIPTNWTTSTTPNPSIILSRITPTQGFILNATQVPPEILAPNGKPFELDTDAKPTDGVTVKDPMVLEDQVINDIISSGFATKKIEHYLGQKLNIDAKEPETGSTLSMYAIWSHNTPAFEFIISKGAHVNVSNVYGETLPMLAAGTGLEDVLDFLIENEKVDFCRKNVYNQTARDLTANIVDFDKQARIYNKLTEAMKKQRCTSYVNQS